MNTNLVDLTLKTYLCGTTNSGELDEILEESGPEAAGGPDILGQKTLEKLVMGETLSPGERFHLEAIIIPERRPAIDIVDGDYQTRHQDWLHLNSDPIRKRLRTALPKIGRVELPDHPTLPYGGTAFIVGDGLLMTNRHVAELFSTGLGLRNLSFIPGMSGGVDFLRERRSIRTFYLEFSKVVMIHPYWDMALVKVEGLPGNLSSLVLSTEPAGSLIGRDVAVIGYPGFDPRNPADVQNFVFDGVYGVKRLQPGRMKAIATVRSYNHAVEAQTHDASTLGGDSGACVLDVTTGEVIGLHFGGRYAVANFCVPTGALATDGRVIDAGVRFAGTASRARSDWEPFWRSAEASAAEPSAITLKTDSAGKSSMTKETGEVTVTVPLEITVRLGAVQTHSVASVAPTAIDDIERAKEPVRDPDYSTRRGYDPDFLGMRVSLPTPRNPQYLARVEDGSHLLHYHHFSLAMHRQRRLAFFTAANVDASKAVKRPENRPQSDYSRKGLANLGPNDQEKWFSDPRILATEQLPDKFFTKDRGSFDKGHIVRRDDVAWGMTYDEMRNANGDTFHVTNCSPQVAGFNRSNLGEDNWGDLENLILSQADTEKLVVFSGPVLEPNDPVFLGVDLEGSVAIRIPQRYWKVIVAEKNGALECFAFLLEQDLSSVELEFLVPTTWKRYMVAVSRIEDLADLDFDSVTRAADQAETTEGVSLAAASGFEASGTAFPPAAFSAIFTSVEDIVSLWREQQTSGKKPDDMDEVRFVVLLGTPLSDATIKSEIETAFNLEVNVSPLFASDRDLDRYRAIDIPGATSDDRADLFDVARAINTLLAAETVEPDLATHYYDSDTLRPSEGSAESANWAFWCWVNEDDPANQPTDKDWAINKTRVPNAWAFSESQGKPSKGKGIKIFQPDTGVVPTHKEMPPKVAKNPLSANFVEGGKSPVDPMTGSGNLGHGTSTGSVAASPVAGLVRGSAPEAMLVPIRCIRSVAVFNQSRVAQAIDHARIKGAHVITMSLGGVVSSALHDAVRKAVKANIIVLAAAGNCVGTVVWPARYDEVIAVGGVNEKDKPWKGSSSGRSVDVSGPAEMVLKADARDASNPAKASAGQGTSYATAHLAGVAACWLAHHGRDALIARLAPGMTLQGLFRGVLAKSSRVPAGFDTDRYGVGIVNAEALIKADPAMIAGLESAPGHARDIEAQVRELLAEVAGAGQAEAAAPVLRDGQSLLELACSGLDMARFNQSAAGQLEARPPMRLSSGLKKLLGDDALKIIR